jgi:hypothetical protein
MTAEQQALVRDVFMRYGVKKVWRATDTDETEELFFIRRDDFFRIDRHSAGQELHRLIPDRKIAVAPAPLFDVPDTNWERLGDC